MHPACGGPSPRAVPPQLCGGAEVYARSYPLVPKWPFESFHLVMELTHPSTCNLYRSVETCCKFAEGRLSDPERHVRETIASVMMGCLHRASHRPCLAVDLGANNGWFTSYMLQLGAHVVSVEPQPDLARALMETVQLNCWSNRSVVLNALACGSNSSKRCMGATDVSECARGWRMTYPVKDSRCARKHGLPDTVYGVTLEDIIFHTSPLARAQLEQSKMVTLDFVKMDADGPEGEWLATIESYIARRRLR
ncbi:MAG: hypothetical protein SGPRY_004697, partial [Prymnesium sp.]